MTATLLKHTLEQTFNQLVAALLDQLTSDEHLTINLAAEQSQFIRFNRAKVRQTGCVQDARLAIALMHNQRVSSYSLPLTGDWQTDWHQAQSALDALRVEVSQLPADPYLVLPTGTATSHELNHGMLLPIESAVAEILPIVAELDFTGIYAGGTSIRGYADSVGQRHWFATDSFALDYSLFTPDGQAVKGTVAGRDWNPAAYTAKLAESRLQLDRLARPPKSVPKGTYRTYLEPTAVADLINMFSWGGVSEAALQRGGSALGALQRGEKQFSAKFTLTENFSRGLVPRFNELGEMAPLTLPLIEQGKLVNSLISSRTAKEYNKTANGAASGEYLRSPELATGQLAVSDSLKALDTGLYLSNLHYLNWSDRQNGRVTGMTRYACFWVEHGEIVAPIENLRFDESLYRCFGENLVDLTQSQEFIPEVGTYDMRELGGSWVPGALVNDFTYTL
jgi:predicted Zn-dependent protease